MRRNVFEAAAIVPVPGIEAMNLPHSCAVPGLPPAVLDARSLPTLLAWPCSPAHALLRASSTDLYRHLPRNAFLGPSQVPHTSCIQVTTLIIFSCDEMFYAEEMDPNPAQSCLRCGNPVTVKPRGRPPRWCSDQCRKLASEERRAAERGAIGLEIRDHTRVVEKPVPERMSAAVAGARAAEDIDAALSVLVALQRKLVAEAVEYKDLDRLYRGINDLRATFRRTVKPWAVGLISYRTEGAAIPDPKSAVPIVLGSPRACAEVITTLTEQVRTGQLTHDPRHDRTRRALADLIRTVRIRE